MTRNTRRGAARSTRRDTARSTTTAILRNFAVIEGCDGSGTSTQLKLLRRRFTWRDREREAFMVAEPEPAYGLPPLFATAEPTGGPVGRLIRLILEGGETVTGETLARLFAADRAEHLYAPGGLVERCRRGELAVSDRYTPSSLVYQGLECGRELPEELNASFPLPELLVYLDVDPRTAMERIQNRGETERYEEPDFQAKVREAYRALLPAWEEAGVRLLSLDGRRPEEELAAEIWSALEKMPIMQGSEQHGP
ncbi:MAG: dTMP kinase [Treponema sp.]|jgi:dTMP kinase|nr:dTMP kinase [Treponema sp.]